MKAFKIKPVKKPTNRQVYDAMNDLENAVDDLRGLTEVLCDFCEAFHEPQSAGVYYLSRRLRDHSEAVEKVHRVLFRALDLPALAAKRTAETTEGSR